MYICLIINYLLLYNLITSFFPNSNYFQTNTLTCHFSGPHSFFLSQNIRLSATCFTTNYHSSVVFVEFNLDGSFVKINEQVRIRCIVSSNKVQCENWRCFSNALLPITHLNISKRFFFKMQLLLHREYTSTVLLTISEFSRALCENFTSQLKIQASIPRFIIKGKNKDFVVYCIESSLEFYISVSVIIFKRS